jgi:DNA modification methylase
MTSLARKAIQMAEDRKNQLYYGDNLDVLRRHIADESVDLVYLDPPFNSNANYNVLFAEKSGAQSASQIQAFSDTWTWNQESEAVFAEVVTAGERLGDCLRAFRTFLGECNMLAYLVMMAPRLAELRRVMKSTASIYLHCDPTASHYLKMLMDAVFGAKRFLSEINWVRTNAHNFQSRFFQRVSDILLFYSKSDEYTWNPQFQPYSEAQRKRYRLDPSTGRFYTGQDLTLMGVSPSRQFEWRGVKPPKNRVWGYSREALEELWENGLILKRSDGSPRLDGRKVYLDEKPGKAITAVWDDVQRVGNTAAERLGYPTQKPVALLERIIQASSNEGDVVLDPFCGCGTTIDAAQKLNRHWIGIDITQLAVTLIKQRLLDTHEEAAVYKVLGEPVSLPDAEKLAENDPYQFQWWALGLVGARPVDEKKGADKGIDGKIIFQGDKPGTFESVILSVKAGKTAVPHVRDLRGVLEREKAAIGVLISLQEPTAPMKTEAVTAGFYESEVWGRKYPKVQLLTIAELLEGKRVDMPPIRQVGATFRKAPRAKDKQGEQQELEI